MGNSHCSLEIFSAELTRFNLVGRTSESSVLGCCQYSSEVEIIAKKDEVAYFLSFSLEIIVTQETRDAVQSNLEC